MWLGSGLNTPGRVPWHSSTGTSVFSICLSVQGGQQQPFNRCHHTIPKVESVQVLGDAKAGRRDPLLSLMQIWSEDALKREPNKTNSYYPSPAECEVGQLISAIRMTFFWHCWRKQEELQTGNVYFITTAPSSVHMHTHTRHADQAAYPDCKHLGLAFIFSFNKKIKHGFWQGHCLEGWFVYFQGLVLYFAFLMA